MKTSIQEWRDDPLHLSLSLRVIRQTADEVDKFSVPELREQIDEIRAFLRQGFLSDLEGLPAHDRVELNRLDEKLDALRERLVYSYFAAAQLRSLQGALYELIAIIERDVTAEFEITVTVTEQGLTASHRQEVLAG